MLNHIVLMGRLTRDPELRYTQSQIPVASFTLAVDRDFGGRDGGEKQTDFIDSCRNRKTFALNESNGFRSCTMFNLAIVAERLGRGFRFDPVALRAVDDQAADRLLYQGMRAPWKKEMWG